MKFFINKSLVLLIFFCFLSLQGFCFKPKTHLYLALRSIESILQGSNSVEIGGFQYAIDPEMATAIREYPGYYLGGIIGPDGFPDILFGQMIIHPDSRCALTNGEWICDDTSSEKSWSWEWFEHLYKAAQVLSGEKKKQALAFVLGYITHGAGDIWAHTFVNYFAKGSWPADLTNSQHLNIAKRHIIIEGIIGNHTPSIKERIAALGGIKAPMDFIREQFFDHPWSKSRSKKSIPGYFIELKASLEQKRSEKMYIPVRPYLNCWIKEIDKGMEEWLRTSLRVAEDLYVNDNMDSALGRLTEFRKKHVSKMLSIDPTGLLASCAGVPDIIGIVTDFLAKLPILKELNEMKDKMVNNLESYLFEKAFGIPLEEFKRYYGDSETYLDSSYGLFTVEEKDMIMRLVSIDSVSGFFNEDSFSVAHNTIQTCRLVLFTPEQLDRILFDFNVGPLYTNPALEPSKRINVMMGFIRSLDGNHQWRQSSPPLPVMEPSRQFSGEMPAWADCAARQNFFEKIFYDWTVAGISIPYHKPDTCKVISLPPR